MLEMDRKSTSWQFIEVNSNSNISKCLNLYQSIDQQVSSRTKNAGVETRQADSNGLWCCVLLPAILVLCSIQEPVSLEYTLTACVSVGLLFDALLFTVFLSISSKTLRENVYGGCVASSLIATLLIYGWIGQGLLLSIALAMPAVIANSLLLRFTLNSFPKTFTIGEATIVCQGTVLAATWLSATILVRLEHGGDVLDFVETIITTVLLALIAMITYISTLDDEDRTAMRLLQTMLLTSGFILIALHVVLGVTFIIDFVRFIFLDEMRIWIIGVWLCLVVAAVVLIVLRVKAGARAQSATRKSFHLLASLVFLPGALLDPELMRLAAGIGGCLLLFVEALRNSRIEPYSPALQSAFNIYCDEKDSGCIAVTPLYLFVGLACPLALAPSEPLLLLSGVLATGVGDSAASWAGSRYGTTRWNGSTRTLEGTACYVISQVVVVYALQLFGVLHTPNALFRTTFAAIVSSLVEAKTSQVDNLVLPLITILAFQMTSFL